MIADVVVLLLDSGRVSDMYEQDKRKKCWHATYEVSLLVAFFVVP
jgi:hypothetical protein